MIFLARLWFCEPRKSVYFLHKIHYRLMCHAFGVHISTLIPRTNQNSKKKVYCLSHLFSTTETIEYSNKWNILLGLMEKLHLWSISSTAVGPTSKITK